MLLRRLCVRSTLMWRCLFSGKVVSNDFLLTSPRMQLTAYILCLGQVIILSIFSSDGVLPTSRAESLHNSRRFNDEVSGRPFFQYYSILRLSSLQNDRHALANLLDSSKWNCHSTKVCRWYEVPCRKTAGVRPYYHEYKPCWFRLVLLRDSLG